MHILHHLEHHMVRFNAENESWREQLSYTSKNRNTSEALLNTTRVQNDKNLSWLSLSDILLKRRDILTNGNEELKLDNFGLVISIRSRFQILIRRSSGCLYTGPDFEPNCIELIYLCSTCFICILFVRTIYLCMT